MAAGAVAVVVTAGPAAGATLLVDDDGRDCAAAAYRTMQAAVDAADPGDTVHVCAGTYPERVRIQKQLTLLGAAHGVDGRSRGFGDGGASLVRSPAPLRLLADGIVVDGFTIVVAPDEDLEGQGVYALGAGFRIANNLLDDGGLAGIVLATSGNALTSIVRNQFRGRYGVAADGEGAARNVVILENLFRAAALLVVDGPSEGVTVADNEFVADDTPEPCEARTCRAHIFLALTRNFTILRNSFADADAVALHAARNTGLRIEGNTFRRGAGDGLVLEGEGSGTAAAGNHFEGFAAAAIRLLDAVGQLVADNRLEDSELGIALEGGAQLNTIRGNTVEDSRGVGIEVGPGASDNVIEGNTARGSGTMDCRDASRGAASAGTANTWRDNEGSRADPEGLCTDRPG